MMAEYEKIRIYKTKNFLNKPVSSCIVGLMPRDLITTVNSSREVICPDLANR